MNNRTQTRGWVKNAAIIFLSVLLVLTFFSNTIMNKSLTEVSVKEVESTSITAKVRGTGKVEAAGKYEVKAPATHTILSVMVRVGEKVEVGDTLFVLGEGASDEILKLTEEIRTLQQSYRTTAAGAPYYDYTIQEHQIELTQSQLEEAQTELENAEAEMEAYYDGNGSYTENIKQAADAVDAAEEKVETAENQYASEKNDYLSRVTIEEENLTDLLNNPVDPPTDPDDVAQNRQYQDYQARLQDAQMRLDAAVDAYEAFIQTGEPQYLTDARTELESKQEAYETLLSAAGVSAQAYTDAKEKVAELEEELFQLQATLDSQKTSDARSSGVVGVELQGIQEQITAKQQELDTLMGNYDNQIVSEVSGTVTSIGIVAGNKANSGDVLCTIEVADAGYTMSFTASNGQVSRLRIGDSATVSNYYWGSQIVATLVSIEPDPQNPQSQKKLTFELTGDVSAGTDLTISVGQKSATYDYVVPNSAIRTDSNGTFVLVVTSKNSSLGNRYYAKRVAVTVAASDDVNSAVTGDISTGDFVIVTSAKPVKSGDQIRMAD